MSKITTHNYEAYYLDYLEGNLSKSDTQLLRIFLDQHPELKLESEGFELVTLHPNHEIIIDKNDLYKTINNKNIEKYIIESVENIIDTDDEKELNEYLTNHEDAKVLADRYKKTILRAPTISFPDKQQLKRKSPVIYLAPAISIAALLLLYLTVFIPNKKPQAIEPLISEQITNSQSNQTTPSKVDSDLNSLTEELGTEPKNPHKTIPSATVNISNTNADTAAKEPIINTTIEKPITEPLQIINLKQASTINNNWNTTLQIPAKQTSNIANSNTSEFAASIEAPKANREFDRKISLIKIAAVGIDIFNRLNETNYDVEPNFTSNGNLKSVTVSTGARKITTPSI